MNSNSTKILRRRQRSWLFPTVIGGALVFLFVTCSCLVAFGLGFMYLARQEITLISDPTPTPEVIRPVIVGQSTPTEENLLESLAESGTSTNNQGSGEKPDLEIIQTPEPVALVPDETLNILQGAGIPTNNPIELAQRLEGKSDIPLTLEPPLEPLTKGTSQSFWITNNDNNQNYLIVAVLHYVTDHSYFWVEEGIEVDEGDLEMTAVTFEEKIYPTVRNFFGSEWTPGVDGDEHLYIVFARGLGSQIAGYYSAADQYHPLAKEYSNAHEMFLMSADILEFGEEYTLTVLAHEFQHMVHWNVDLNEESWVNEGFSELASFINGYGVGYHDYAYIDDPDIQLTDWPNEDRTPHYGAAFLFLNYFLNRFGPEITQELVASPYNGLESINQLLASMGVTDPLTGERVTADDIVLDWLLASYLKDETVSDGRYTYANYPDAPQASSTDTISRCPSGVQTRDVSQYGGDYIDITCHGSYHLALEGSIQVPVLPVDPYSGKYYFWSNRGDESDMTLTRTFDFRNHDGSLTLTYWTWFDIEKDYDYLYLEYSVDNGETWDILITPSGTAEDPSGASYGWAYNGPSGNPGLDGAEHAHWIQESIDLTHLVGNEVMLRFEYITDPAVNGYGLVLDDVAIPEIGYFSDFEEDDGGWHSKGFVRIENLLPQTYMVGIIRFGEDTVVEKYSLQNDNSISIPIEIGNEYDRVVLVITGSTPFTREKSAYRFEVK